MQFFIREAFATDASEITRLSNQLGYAISETDTLTNLTAILQNKTETVRIAGYGEEIVGWIHIFKTVRVESGAFAEIGGLIVDEKYRNRGVGKLLTDHAKQWCREMGIMSLRVRCNTKRKEAHIFYTSIGFRETKEQKVFAIHP